MSSKRNLQEFESSERNDSRKKVDVRLIETMLPQHTEVPATRHWQREAGSLQVQPHCDLRKSLAWDSAFFTSPGILDSEEMFETLDFRVMDNGVDIARDKEPRSLTSIEPAKAGGIGDCSMRKSLAWDSAFFTSAGVLDSEELSIVNRGYKKSDAQMLPGIEEICRSSESNSTMDSISYSLESLEIDLFGDVRASLCKSGKASYHGATSTGKSRRGRVNRSGHSKYFVQSVRVDIASRVPDASLGGRAKDVQLEEAPTTRESRFSSKPPKVAGSKNPPPRAHNKMSSPLGARHIKMENETTKATYGKSKTLSKRTCLRDSCSIVSSSTATMKSPSSVLPHTSHHFSAFSSAQSHFTNKTPPNAMRKTTKSRQAASLSISSTPWKRFAGTNNKLVNSADFSSSLSTPKSSSCTSPASSVDESSSGSSSLSLKQRSNGSAGLGSSPYREISFDIDASQSSNYQISPSDISHIGHENQETRVTDPQINRRTVRTSPVPVTLSRTGVVSGLRMPSPKMGFFEDNPTGFVSYGDAAPRIVFGNASLNGAANKSRCCKQRSSGTLAGISSKNAVKDGTQLKEKKQPLRRREDAKVPDNACRPEEANKENIANMENQIEDLSKTLKSIELIENKSFS
ncbi:hypothetical protein Tsubulata_026857 [Turnera subulata]|uniref:Uncharacterized protein n=1 Tax=Turnera subulata TaxID=218843 RepID=A0A9Q0GA34_9ROSI|nr:hypothetical protein Tsubulata_026857 [Turnera subulata]